MNTPNWRLVPFILAALPAIIAADAASANIQEVKRLEAAGSEFSTSFESAWSEFETACRSGDVKALTEKCDERILKELSRADLADLLGDGWKADSLVRKRRVLLIPHGKRPAAALVLVEISEFGYSNLQAMWWVFRESKWRCCNLPFERTLLGPRIKYPPFAED